MNDYYYASIPTYIPPANLSSDFPSYEPATTRLTRSRSNRIVYADDPWNSAENPELFAPQRRLSSDRAQQPRRLTKRANPPSIDSIFSPEDNSRQEQMNVNRPGLPPSLTPGGGSIPYPATAPPYLSTFSTKQERKLSFQSVSSVESYDSASPIQSRGGGIDLPKPRPKTKQPTPASNSRPRISPPPSPAPAGAGMPASLIPGSRFSSNLSSIDVWADIRSTLDHPSPRPSIKRRAVIKLNQPQHPPVPRGPPPQQQAPIVQAPVVRAPVVQHPPMVRGPPPQRQAPIVQAPVVRAPVVQPTERPGPSRSNVPPPKAERRARPTSAPADDSMSRQRTQYHGEWVVVPGPRPSSMPTIPTEAGRASDRSPPTIPQLQLGAPFPVLVNKRVSLIQREEGVANRPLKLQAPAPAPTPSPPPPAKNSSIEKPLDLPVETYVAPLAVTRQPPSRKETTDTFVSQPSRPNTVFFAEAAQLTPSPSLTAAIQSVTKEMSVDLSEPPESGSAVHWDVVDTVLKRQGADRRKSLPRVMRRQSLRLTSESLDSVDDCIGCEECFGVCGHMEQVEHFDSPAEDDSSLEEEEQSADDSDVDDLLAAWEEEDRMASPTKVVSEVVKRLREEKQHQDQLWDDVRGLLASRGRQGSCDTNTETDLISPASNYSH
ncbi:hypothetical protein FRC00_006476 [Tulasnella sp. 408]|nr:hypothetical protein FRC00_006476 [Tulasnella sp. 408]